MTGIERERSVNTAWVPGHMPPGREFTLSGNNEESLDEYRDYMLQSIEHYPKAVSMTLKGVTFTELLEWVEDWVDPAVTDPVIATRDLVKHLLGDT